MNTKYKFNKTARQVIKPVLLILSVTLPTALMAATNHDTLKGAGDSTASKPDNTAYVDSVHQWGAWELDIEPAAGGLQAQATQPLNARGSKVSLRTNSISALAPPAPVIAPATPPTTPPAIPPITPPITPPVTPPIPTITPVNPSVPIPIGGPGVPGGGPGNQR